MNADDLLTEPSRGPMPRHAEEMRLDKWLWCMRLFKSRQQSADACRLGRVKCLGQPVKPARDVAAGETYEIARENFTQTVRVRAIPAQRLAARWVPDFMDDLTPTEVREQAREARIEDRLASPTYHWDPHHLSRERHKHR